MASFGVGGSQDTGADESCGALSSGVCTRRASAAGGGTRRFSREQGSSGAIEKIAGDPEDLASAAPGPETAIVVTARRVFRYPAPMDSGLYVLVSLTGLTVRVVVYLIRQKEAKEAKERDERDHERDDPELERLIREKELGGAAGDDKASAGPYRSAGRVRQRPPRSTGPVTDEAPPRRCARCDMRVSPDEEHCASCVKTLAKKSRTR